MMRYARPVIMQESCVGCHNSMESSPRKDWEVGEVRGVHAVSLTLPVISTVILERFSSTSLLMLGGTIISLLLLAIFIRELRRSLLLVEAYARETEATNLVLTKTNAPFPVSSRTNSSVTSRRKRSSMSRLAITRRRK